MIFEMIRQLAYFLFLTCQVLEKSWKFENMSFKIKNHLLFHF